MRPWKSARDRTGLLHGRVQRGGVVGDVLADETGDEVVAVVVARAQVQRERVADLFARGFQQLGLQLGQEFIVRTLVDQDRQAFLGARNQRHGVVRQPFRAVIAQVGGEDLRIGVLTA